jgi:Myb/SANT-like DNA-binding domain
MAPRRQNKPAEALNTQIIDFSATEDNLMIDPQPLPESHPESHSESQSLQPPTPSLPNTPSQPSIEDQLDRLEWTPEMIKTLFTELLDQALDGKRADSGFKKEAWDSVLREVRAVYTGSIMPYALTYLSVRGWRVCSILPVLYLRLGDTLGVALWPATI